MEVSEMQALCLRRSEEWFPKTAHDLVHHTLAMAGEVGEFCNLLKKVERGSVDLSDDTLVELAMELTDVLIYVLSCAAIMNVDLGMAFQLKMDFNEERFGAGSPDNADGDARPDNDDEVPDGTTSFVPIADISKPL